MTPTADILAIKAVIAVLIPSLMTEQLANYATLLAT
jgi:hypothetical protein